MSTYVLADFKVGDRIEVHPATDRWMMGDRYATVVRIGTKNLTVKFDRSNRVMSWHPNAVYDLLSPFQTVGYIANPECMCDHETRVQDGCDHS